MRKKLLESKESQSLVMKTFIHEMKNPITALMFQIDNLRASLPVKYKSDLDSMETEVQRLADLSIGIGDFLKNPVGNPEKICVVSLIEGLAKNTTTSLVIKANDPNCFVYFDADRARSVLENLIKNACESNPKKDARVDVEISSSADKVCIKVMDRGEGIDLSKIDKLFEFGFTTKSNGSGIGLFLAKHFVDSVGGSLNLYAREGGGTVSEVVLPLKLKK